MTYRIHIRRLVAVSRWLLKRMKRKTRPGHTCLHSGLHEAFVRASPDSLAMNWVGVVVALPSFFRHLLLSSLQKAATALKQPPSLGSSRSNCVRKRSASVGKKGPHTAAYTANRPELLTLLVGDLRSAMNGDWLYICMANKSECCIRRIKYKQHTYL